MRVASLMLQYIALSTASAPGASCTCMCVDACMGVDACMCVDAYMCADACMCVDAYMCADACRCVDACICVDACMCVDACICVDDGSRARQATIRNCMHVCGCMHAGTTQDACSIRVGDQTRSWTEGKVLVLDDAFEHEVCPLPSAIGAPSLRCTRSRIGWRGMFAATSPVPPAACTPAVTARCVCPCPCLCLCLCRCRCCYRYRYRYVPLPPTLFGNHLLRSTRLASYDLRPTPKLNRHCVDP